MDIMTIILLVLAALLPAAFYVFYIVAFDSYKQEPPSMLVLSALLGMMVAVAIIYLGRPYQLGELQIGATYEWKDAIATSFLRLALPVEIAKWMVLCIFFSLNKYYDEFIDGIVYSVCLAMGYAGVWGAFFLIGMANEGFPDFMETVVMAALLLIPLHLIAGTVMGYYLALARRSNKVRNHVLALLLPILVNGIICFIALMVVNNRMYFLILDVLLVVLGMFFYTMICKLQRMDGVDGRN